MHFSYLHRVDGADDRLHHQLAVVVIDKDEKEGRERRERRGGEGRQYLGDPLGTLEKLVLGDCGILIAGSLDSSDDLQLHTPVLCCLCVGEDLFLENGFFATVVEGRGG